MRDVKPDGGPCVPYVGSRWEAVLEQIKVRLMEELQTPVAFHNPALRGIPVTPACGGVLAGDGGADPGGGAGDPAIEAP